MKMIIYFLCAVLLFGIIPNHNAKANFLDSKKVIIQEEKEMTQTYKVQVSMNQAHIVESGFVWKQGDFGFNIEIEVLDFDTTGATPQIIFRKSTGAVEATEITSAGNKFTYAIRGTELDTPGPCVCDLKLKDSTTKRVSTASFKYFVIPDTMDGLEQEASSYSDTIAQLLENTLQKSTTNGLVKNDGSINTTIESSVEQNTAKIDKLNVSFNNEIQNDVNAFAEVFNKNTQIIPAFINHNVNASTGAINPGINNERITTQYIFIPANSYIDLTLASGYELVSYYYYDKTLAYIGQARGNLDTGVYCLITFKKTTGTITPLEGRSNITIRVKSNIYQKSKVASLAEKANYDILLMGEFENGNYSGITDDPPTNISKGNQARAYAKLICENVEDGITIYTNSNWGYVYSLYVNGTRKSYITDWRYVNTNLFYGKGTYTLYITVRKSDNTVFAPSDIIESGMKILPDYYKDTILSELSDIKNRVEMKEIVNKNNFSIGGMNVYGEITEDPTRLVTRTPIKIENGMQYVFDFSSETLSHYGYKTYDENMNVINASPWVESRNGIFTALFNEKYVRFILKKANNSNCYTSDLTEFNFTEKDDVGQNYHWDNYAKHRLSFTKIGTIQTNQGFCKYGEYYYSVNANGNVYKYNKDFTVVAEASINVGHGNALQIGSGNIAYASGWDDNKVYAIDLDTLTLTDTISLPTTGYTTCAVDDINKLVYIFQRDSLPDTLANYNFIVYNYDTQTIISTKQISTLLAYQQGLDFYNDHIYATFGSGVVSGNMTNNFLVFDTNGNITSEYSFGSMYNREPEDIQIDRVTHDIYISTNNGTDYFVFIVV